MSRGAIGSWTLGNKHGYETGVNDTKWRVLKLQDRLENTRVALKENLYEADTLVEEKDRCEEALIEMVMDKKLVTKIPTNLRGPIKKITEGAKGVRKMMEDHQEYDWSPYLDPRNLNPPKEVVKEGPPPPPAKR